MVRNAPMEKFLAMPLPKHILKNTLIDFDLYAFIVLFYTR